MFNIGEIAKLEDFVTGGALLRADRPTGRGIMGVDMAPAAVREMSPRSPEPKWEESNSTRGLEPNNRAGIKRDGGRGGVYECEVQKERIGDGVDKLSLIGECKSEASPDEGCCNITG